MDAGIINVLFVREDFVLTHSRPAYLGLLFSSAANFFAEGKKYIIDHLVQVSKSSHREDLDGLTRC
jgi:hypothetical protein